MDTFKRVGWSFVMGFAACLGAALALFLVLAGYDYASKAWKSPSPYESLVPGDAVAIKDLRFAELTANGGVRGVATNLTSLHVSSAKVDLVLAKGPDVLHRCQDWLTLELEPGESTEFVMTCKELDPRKLTPDIQPKLVVKSVLPKPLARAR